MNAKVKVTKFLHFYLNGKKLVLGHKSNNKKEILKFRINIWRLTNPNCLKKKSLFTFFFLSLL